MKELVLTAIEKFNLIKSGDMITVALSGGADSVALLHVLVDLKEQLNITVKATHVNHLIRGEEADRDQRFVEQLCQKLGVELVCERIDVPLYAKESHQSIETAARQVRYDFFERTASGLVATAHTASDNLETVLLNLTRGTALKGLCGIPAKRDIYIRPLILCSRQQIENYCFENGLSFVTDSTNLSDEYTRNKIRHNVIPTLKKLNPSVEDALSKAVMSLSEDNLALDYASNELLFKCLCDDGLLVKSFSQVPSAIAKRTIIKFVYSVYPQITLDNFHINAVYDICLKDGKVNLPENLFAVTENGVLTVVGDDVAEIPKFKVTLKEIPNVNNLLANDLLDCDKIIGDVVVRTRQKGDSIRLKNRGCTKTLNKLFTENHIPVKLRDILPVIADDAGVIWVYGMGVAQRCVPTQGSKKFLCIEIRKIG